MQINGFSLPNLFSNAFNEIFLHRCIVFRYDGNKNNPITLNATELNVAQKYITKKRISFLFLQKKVIMERP